MRLFDPLSRTSASYNINTARRLSTVYEAVYNPSPPPPPPDAAGYHNIRHISPGIRPPAHATGVATRRAVSSIPSCPRIRLAGAAARVHPDPGTPCETNPPGRPRT